MDALKIIGGATLRGEVRVSGSKNASLPIMAVRTLTQVLSHMGARIERQGRALLIDAESIPHPEARCDLVRTMRASILVLGPLLARFGHAKVSLPGGCAIGARPIDQHLKGLEKLGAKISLEHGNIHATASSGLIGAEVVFDMPTVTGTENLMLAAVLAQGTTVLRNAAQEPEVTDLAEALISMGAKIQGAGTREIIIEGQKLLRPCRHNIMADRIECGTLLVAGAMAGDPLMVKGGIAEHQRTLVDKLRAMGAKVEIDDDTMRVTRPHMFSPVDVQTAPYY
ncbi:UDP N acetylglucosamine 1 carboxyvinyltransferase [Roridomyces roridus]|uniref:UDP-N-acetylglucosamine 1-carboxyvinyltransferase n=1 Tax=Roridomyces roridus TaxID=1738132 RepID=A0AAD7FNZ2_9AGAR|nr:UDP N acetylglucosamine 1 carboxyvinyltransferase [Roridomyces roridus]